MFVFWRLAARAGLRLTHHYVLHPNPWPKPAHLLRRVHGHPAFSALLTLGGRLEVRTNWRVYVDEMHAALSLAGIAAPAPGRLEPEGPLTPFEAKYVQRGHALWRLAAELGRWKETGSLVPGSRERIAAPTPDGESFDGRGHRV